MKNLLLIASLALLPLCALAAPSTPALPSIDTIPAQNGPIRVTAIFHGTVQVEHNGKVVIVDPFSPGTYRKKADVILITHTHPDHLDTRAIAKLLKPGTLIVCPPAAYDRIRSLREDMLVQTMRNGQSGFPRDNSGRQTLTWLRIQAVPAYNVVRGPGAGQKFHPKGQFNGYVVTLGGKRLYFAGDTEAVPEMKNLTNIDAAFLPMNLPYTMTPQEAARGARSFQPKMVYPYHFRYPFGTATTTPHPVAAALKGTKIKVKLLNFYPAAAIAKAGMQ